MDQNGSKMAKNDQKSGFYTVNILLWIILESYQYSC
jgi:hypothetical protein